LLVKRSKTYKAEKILNNVFRNVQTPYAIAQAVDPFIYKGRIVLLRNFIKKSYGNSSKMAESNQED